MCSLAERHFSRRFDSFTPAAATMICEFDASLEGPGVIYYRRVVDRVGRGILVPRILLKAQWDNCFQGVGGGKNFGARIIYLCDPRRRVVTLEEFASFWRDVLEASADPFGINGQIATAFEDDLILKEKAQMMIVLNRSVVEGTNLRVQSGFRKWKEFLLCHVGTGEDGFLSNLTPEAKLRRLIVYMGKLYEAGYRGEQIIAYVGQVRTMFSLNGGENEEWFDDAFDKIRVVVEKRGEDEKYPVTLDMIMGCRDDLWDPRIWTTRGLDKTVKWLGMALGLDSGLRASNLTSAGVELMRLIKGGEELRRVMGAVSNQVGRVSYAILRESSWFSAGRLPNGIRGGFPTGVGFIPSLPIPHRKQMGYKTYPHDPLTRVTGLIHKLYCLGSEVYKESRRMGTHEEPRGLCVDSTYRVEHVSGPSCSGGAALMWLFNFQ
eukprot:gene12242-25715_t